MPSNSKTSNLKQLYQFIINKDVIGIFSPFIDTDVCDDLFFTQETT